MPRAKFICDPSVPYHLVSRTNERKAFAVPMETAWSVFSEQLFFLHHAFGVRIHAFVLMNNHFHLIASFPRGNLSRAMSHFLGTVSRVLAFESNSMNHIFGSRVFRSRLGTVHYFSNAYKYLFMNPVRAGLCERVEEYKYSSLSGLLGLRSIGIPIEEDSLLFGDIEGVLEWLNERPADEDVDAMRRALRREDFSLPRDNRTLRANRLESELL